MGAPVLTNWQNLKFVEKRKLNLNQITILEEIYPRETVSEERILEFVEQHGFGSEFPAIKVVSHAEKYILLDGRHRREMYRRLSVEAVDVEVMELPEREWRLYAAACNRKQARDLNEGELANTILRVYSLDGFKNVREIAAKLGCSVRRVQEILKPTRDQENEEKIARARELSHKGLSHEEIAKEISEQWGREICRRAVSYWLAQDQDNSFTQTSEPSNEGLGKKRGPRFFPKASTDCTSALPENDLEDGSTEEFDPAGGQAPGCQEENQPFETTREDSQETPEQLIQSPTESPDSPFDRSNLVAKLKQIMPVQQYQRTTAVTLDVIRETGLGYKAIAHEYGLGEVWIREAAVILLMLHHYFSPEDIVDRLEVDEQRVWFTKSLLNRFESDLPSSGELFRWFEFNGGPYRSRLTYAVREAGIRKITAEAGISPNDPDAKEPFTGSIEELQTELQSCQALYEKLGDLAKRHTFSEQQLKGLRQWDNIVIIKRNRFVDILRKN